MNPAKQVLLIAATLVLVSGCCAWFPKMPGCKSPPVTTAPDLPAIGKAVEGSAKAITTETGKAVVSIDKATGGVKESLTTAGEPAKTILNAEVLPNLDAALISCLIAQAEARNLTTQAVPQIAKAANDTAKLAAERDAALAAQAKAEDETAKAQETAEKSALLWMMLIGIGFVAAGAGLGYFLKSVTLGVGLGVTGIVLIVVSRMLAAVDRLLTDHPIVSGLVALGLIVGAIALVGWRAGWFKKAWTQTVAGVQKARNEINVAADSILTTALKEKQDTGIQVASKAEADKVQAVIDTKKATG